MSKQSGAGEDKPAALLLSPEAPYPLAGGGPLRTASIVEYLATRYNLDLIAFREPGADDPRAHLPSGLVGRADVIDLPFHSKDTWSRTGRNLKRLARGAPPLVDRFSHFDAQVRRLTSGRRYRVGFLEHFWCASYAPILREVCDRVILDLHNIESVLLSRCSKSESWPQSVALQRFASACRKLETSLLPHFDLLLVSSPEDRELSRSIAPGVQSIVYPNAIPFASRPSVTNEDAIVFSGNLAYQPNAQAIRYFYSQIWPSLAAHWPDFRWMLAGKSPESVPERIRTDSRVLLTGPMDNAIETIARGKVAIVPLLAGSGTRIKIIEAWAAAVPVVSTSVGAEGLSAVPGKHLLIADNPAAFSRAVSSLLESEDLSRRIGNNGRALYESELTWQSAWKRLAEAGI